MKMLCQCGRKEEGNINIGFIIGRTKKEIIEKKKRLNIRCHGEYFLYKPPSSVLRWMMKNTKNGD